MKWLNKLKLFGLGILASLAFSPKKAQACSDAKPIGRAGTNVAIADGASAVYWNPAGLVQLERPELDLTFSANYNYKSFLCYAHPLDNKSALGFNFSNRTNITYARNGGEIEKKEYETDWIKLGYSRKLTEKLSAGANLTFIRNYLNDKLLTSDEQSNYPVHIEDTLLTVDFGLLYKYSDKIKLGLLLQGPVNARPGISFKLDNKTMLVLEGYDILGVYKRSGGYPWRHFCSGLERKVNDKWSVRTGFSFWENNDLRNTSAGATYRKNNLETSAALVYWGPFDSDVKSFLLTLNKKF